MSKKRWQDKSEDHDFPAAGKYLRYHRICASYPLDENAEIPCRLVDLP